MSGNEVIMLTKEQIEVINFGVKTAEKIAGESLKSIEGKSATTDIRSVSAIATFMRIMDIYAGVIACIKIKKPVNSYILIRTMSEAVVLLKGITTDLDFAKQLHNKSVNEKKARIARLRRDFGKTGFKLSVDELDNLINRTEAEKLQEIAAATHAYDTFKRFNALDIYHQVFSHCSLYAHNDSLSLGEYFDENNISDGLKYNRELFKQAGLALLLAMKLVLFSSEYMASYLKVEIKDKESIAELYNNFEKQLIEVINENGA